MRDLLTLTEVAERLRLDGRQLERAVRRLIRQHDVPVTRLGRNRLRLTEAQFTLLLERMTCSISASEASTGTAAAPSASDARRKSSKSTVRDAVNARLRRPTKPSSSTISGKSSSTGPQLVVDYAE